MSGLKACPAPSKRPSQRAGPRGGPTNRYAPSPALNQPRTWASLTVNSKRELIVGRLLWKVRFEKRAAEAVDVLLAIDAVIKARRHRRICGYGGGVGGGVGGAQGYTGHKTHRPKSLRPSSVFLFAFSSSAE